MREKEVLRRAFAMPLTNPSYPTGPYRFVNREYLIIPEPFMIERLRLTRTPMVRSPLSTFGCLN